VIIVIKWGDEIYLDTILMLGILYIIEGSMKMQSDIPFTYNLAHYKLQTKTK